MLSGVGFKATLTAVGAVGRQVRSFDDLAAGLDGALRQAPSGLTVAGAASFAATQGQESAWFRTTREYADESADYWPWIGRTFEQLTHEEAYRRFGQWCHVRGLVSDPLVFVKDPRALEDYRWAWLGGVFYFEWRGLWSYANRGNHYAVSQGVNRGPKAIGTSKVPSHWTERDAMYRAFLRAGPALLPTVPVDDGQRRRQQHLLVA